MKAIVVTAPEHFKQLSYETSIFLAGAIDMGAAVDWQKYVIEQLADVENLIIVNPRRAAFTPDTLDEQVIWELSALENVDRIFMWFSKDAKAPISFFEAGLYWHTSKLIVGAEMGFYRRRNLELTADRYQVGLYDNLDRMVMRVRWLLKQRSGMTDEEAHHAETGE